MVTDAQVRDTRPQSDPAAAPGVSSPPGKEPGHVRPDSAAHKGGRPVTGLAYDNPTGILIVAGGKNG